MQRRRPVRRQRHGVIGGERCGEMRRIGKFVAADILVEAGAAVGCGTVIDAVERILARIGIVRIVTGKRIEAGIARRKRRGPRQGVGHRVHAEIVGFGAGVSERTRAMAKLPRNQIIRQYAVRRLAGERFYNVPQRTAGGAIHEVDRFLAVVDPRVFVAAREAELQARHRFPCRLKFGAPHRGVEVQVHRGTIHDVGDLVAFVIVEEDVAVQRQCAVERRVLGAQFESIVEFGREGFGMRRIADAAARIDGEHRARRIGAAGLVAMRVGEIDHALIGEIELGRPVQHGAARPFAPFLIEIAGGGITEAVGQQFAGDFDEMFAVVGPAQTAREFQVSRDVVVHLSEHRIGIQRVGILAQEVIVARIVQLRERMGIDITQAIFDAGRNVRVGILVAVWHALLVEGLERHPGMVAAIQAVIRRIHGDGVEEDVIVFFGFVMQVVGADAEIERTAEIGRQPHFLAELPGMFVGQIFADEPAAASQLRIAEIAGGRALGLKAAGIDVARRHAILADGEIAVIAAVIAVRRHQRVGRRTGAVEIGGGKDSRLGVETVVILRRPQEILVVAGRRIDREGRRNAPFRVQLQRVVFRLVGRIERRFDIAQIARLQFGGIGIAMRAGETVDQRIADGKAEARADESAIIRQRQRIRHFECVGAVHGGRHAALAEKFHADLTIRTRRRRNAVYGVRPVVAFAKLLGAAQPVVAFLEMLPDEIGGDAFDRRPAQRGARRPQIAPVDGRVRQRVEAVAVALGPFAGQADRKLAAHDGDIDHAFVAAVRIIAPIGGEHGLELIGGRRRNDIHHAGGGIASVERALRPAQHFHLGDVVEFLLEEMVADERRIVERNRHRRIGGDGYRLRADAADFDGIAGEVRFRESEIGNLFHQIGAAGDLPLRQLLLRQRGDRDGDRLDIALDLRRGDHNGFHACRGGRRNPQRFLLRAIHAQARFGAFGFAHDADDAARMAIGHETRIGQNVRERLVRREIALHAAGMSTANGFIRYQNRHARLARIGIERAFEIAGRNVEFLGACAGRKRQHRNAAQQNRFETMVLHESPLACSFSAKSRCLRRAARHEAPGCAAPHR